MRRLHALIILSAWFAWSPAAGQIIPFSDLDDFFSKSNKALANLAAGLDGARESGRSLGNEQTVFAIKRQLFVLNGRLAGLVGRKEFIISTLREYLDSPSPEGWKLAQRELQIVKAGVVELMTTIQAESPTLVEVTGPQLVSNLMSITIARSAVVDQLVDMSEPRTFIELELLHRLVDRYDGLVSNLRRLDDSLFQYVQKFQR
jgi:hypothetical protein